MNQGTSVGSLASVQLLQHDVQTRKDIIHCIFTMPMQLTNSLMQLTNSLRGRMLYLCHAACWKFKALQKRPAAPGIARNSKRTKEPGTNNPYLYPPTQCNNTQPGSKGAQGFSVGPEVPHSTKCERNSSVTQHLKVPGENPELTT